MSYWCNPLECQPKLCASVQVLSKAPRGCEDGKTTKQGWNSTLQWQETPAWKCTQALDFPLLLRLYPHLSEQQAMRLSSPHIGTDAHTHIPLLTGSDTEGEKQNQFEQRGKRWQADGSSAPIQTGVVVWVVGGGWGVNKGVLYMSVIRFLHKPQRLIPCLRVKSHILISHPPVSTYSNTIIRTYVNTWALL